MFVILKSESTIWLSGGIDATYNIKMTKTYILNIPGQSREASKGPGLKYK